MLCLTNIGFVQCCSLGSRKVCCTLVFNFVLFSNFCFCVLCLTNIGFVQCFSFGSRKVSYTLLLRFILVRTLSCVFCLTNTGFVQCYSLGPRKVYCMLVLNFALFSNFLLLLQCSPFGSRSLLHAFVVSNLCFVLFASPTSGLCSAFPLGSPQVYTLLFFFV